MMVECGWNRIIQVLQVLMEEYVRKIYNWPQNVLSSLWNDAYKISLVAKIVHRGVLKWLFYSQCLPETYSFGLHVQSSTIVVGFSSPILAVTMDTWDTVSWLLPTDFLIVSFSKLARIPAK